VQQKIFDLTDNRQTLISRKIGEVLKETIVAIDKVLKSKKQITGISSGFETLDQYTSGFQPSEFIVIGARPSIGKTALALNMISSISIGKNIPSAFFTLEMSDLALTQRIISSEAMVESNALRSGFITPGEYTRILHACEKMYEAPLYIVDMPNMKMLDLRAQARRLRSQQKVEIVFIDYLGLIGSENSGQPRYDQISEISRSLKSLARELRIPIVVLCQLTREAERERPNLSNLRDSGSIEQDADVVMFLHRDRVSDKKPNEPVNQGEGLPTDLIIAKQRNGPVGTIKLSLISRCAKFVPRTREP
jgi:replicative DNA helicase